MFKAFQTLKELLTQAPTLAYPYTGEHSTFAIVTDASHRAIGMALHQQQADSSLRPVAFQARKLSTHELNYPVQEKELLAVVEAFRVFRTYVQGCKEVTVYTDHHSLTTFLSQQHLTGRKARWAEKLSPYANYLRIVHTPGKHNHVDGLSR